MIDESYDELDGEFEPRGAEECGECGAMLALDGNCEACDDEATGPGCGCDARNYCPRCADDPMPEDWAGTIVAHDRFGIGAVVALSEKRSETSHYLTVKFKTVEKTVLRDHLAVGHWAVDGWLAHGNRELESLWLWCPERLAQLKQERGGRMCGPPLRGRSAEAA